MGLLTTYSAANRVITSDSVPTYSGRLISGEWTFTSGMVTTTYYYMYEYHRYRTKEYRYVGMNYATALACATDAQNYYLRNARMSIWNDTNGTFDRGSYIRETMANIAIEQVAGEMYDVIISVNEDDSALSRTSYTSISSLFTTENSRGYDTGSSAFA